MAKPQSRKSQQAEKPDDGMREKMISINRVTKVVKGGRILGFAALTVVGDGDGNVGVGYGKAKEVPAAIAKGVEEAKKHLFKVPMVQRTIPHPVIGERAAGVVMLRPASPGTGVIAGGPVRAVLECAGIHDVLSKSLGSSNQINIVHATVAALQMLEQPEAVAARRGLPVEDVAPDGTVSRITGGWQVVSHRALDRTRSRYLDGLLVQPYHPFTRATQVNAPAGAVVPVDVEVFPTGAVIQPGHRLRLSVQAFDVPHLLSPLPNLLSQLMPLTIHTSPAHPSTLTLPVRP